MKVYQIKNTPAEQDYHGCGDGILVLKNGTPQKLLYIPARIPAGSDGKDDIAININIDPANVDEIEKTTEIFRGMASCHEFVAIEKLYPKEK